MEGKYLGRTVVMHAASLPQGKLRFAEITVFCEVVDAKKIKKMIGMHFQISHREKYILERIFFLKI